MDKCIIIYYTFIRSREIILNTTQKIDVLFTDTSDKIIANFQGPTLHYILYYIMLSCRYCV